VADVKVRLAPTAAESHEMNHSLKGNCRWNLLFHFSLQTNDVLRWRLREADCEVGWVGWCLTALSAQIAYIGPCPPSKLFLYNTPTLDRWLNQDLNPGPSVVQTIEGLHEGTEHLDIFLFFRPSLNGVLFPTFCLLVEGECQILVF